MNILLTLFSAVLIFMVFYIFHHRKSQNATTVPIHRSLDPFTAFDVQLKNHFNLNSLVQQHARYGTSFQMTPLVAKPIIYTISPENIKEIMTNGKDFGVEPLRGESMGPFCGRGFLTSDGDAWMASRKMLKPCFGKRYIEDLTALDHGVDAIIERVRDEGGTIDLQPLLIDLFLDTSFQFLLGTDAKESHNGSEAPPCSRDQFLSAFDAGLLGTGLRIMLGHFRRFLPSKGYLKTCGRVHGWLEFYIHHQSDLQNASAAQLPEKKSSMAEKLSGQTEDIAYVRGQILQSMLASKETTAILVSNTIFLLARHPAVYQKLRGEILQHSKRDELFIFDRLSSFTYLQNILKESMRIHPVFPMNGRIALRNTSLPTSPIPSSPQQTQLQAVPVPAGTTLVMSFYALNRNEAVFGTDTESFVPERWESIHPNQYEYMPFGGGQRACLGREKSLAEAALVVARLAEQFERLESKDGRAFKPKLSISCSNANGCKVALSK